MNSPRSQEGNIIRLTIFAIGYAIVWITERIVANQKNISIIGSIIFALIAWIVLFFYIYSFNREKHYFERVYEVGLLDKMPLTIGLTLIVTLIQILVSYLQTSGKIDAYPFQLDYVKYASNKLFWFLIIAKGIVLPTLQIYIADGFLFNYMFRGSQVKAAILGIITSGVIYSVLNFQFSIPLFLIQTLMGMLFAWSYLYTQNLTMPLYLSIMSNILTVIMA